MNRKLFLGIFAVASVAAAAPVFEVNFAQTDLSKIRFIRIGSEVADGALRCHVVAAAQGNYGRMLISVPAIPEGTYLQFKMGAYEKSATANWIGSASSHNPGSFGLLYRGWNTFSPNRDKGFSLSIDQLGNGKNVGSWMDYQNMRIVTRPDDGLVVSVKDQTSPEAVKVGDTLVLTYYAAEKSAKPVTARFFSTPKMSRAPQPWRIGADDRIRLTWSESEKLYRAEVPVTAEAETLDTTDGKRYVQALAESDGLPSYYTLPCPVAVKTAHVTPAELTSAATLEVRDNRKRWLSMAKGENLALGKKVRFIPAPNYRLTTEAGDATDLTDGKLSAKDDDRIWFAKDSVGFYGNTDVARLSFDLGSVQPVDSVVIRALGGTAGAFRFPSKISVMVSKDGQTWHHSGSIQKTAPAESDQSDFVSLYYYPESGPTQFDIQMQPIPVKVNAEARYLTVNVTLDKHFFSDEIVITKANQPGADFNHAYQSPGFAVAQSGLVARPRLPMLAMVRGIAAPQELIVDDLRQGKELAKANILKIELPEPLGIHGLSGETITIDHKPYRRFAIPLSAKLKLPTLYFDAPKNAPENLPNAWMYFECDGVPQFKTELPVQLVTLPEFKAFEKIPVVLDWMYTEDIATKWPDFYRNYARFGFNGAGIFPRWWGQHKTEAPQAVLAELRKNNFKLYMNDSTFHGMIKGHKPGSEVFCRLPDGKSTLTCPSYTGEFYAKEMERVARCVEMSKPDMVVLDIECFHHLARAANECSRCREAVKASGKSAEDFMKDCGSRQMRDIQAAVAKGAAAAGMSTPPPIGMYGINKVKPVYGTTDFNLVYPRILNSSQPSLYVGGHPETVHDVIRANYRAHGNRDILPWLSPGCYGEFDSYLVEPIVLEALLNGAGGIFYYHLGDFTDSPLDFYYQALALAKLAPYEKIIVEGKVLEPVGSNDKLFYSGIKLGDDMLLLVGNYLKAPESTTVKLPFKSVQTAMDLNSGKKVSAAPDFKINVPKGHFALYYLNGK